MSEKGTEETPEKGRELTGKERESFEATMRQFHAKTEAFRAQTEKVRTTEGRIWRAATAGNAGGAVAMLSLVGAIIGSSGGEGPVPAVLFNGLLTFLVGLGASLAGLFLELGLIVNPSQGVMGDAENKVWFVHSRAYKGFRFFHIAVLILALACLLFGVISGLLHLHSLVPAPMP